MSVKTDISTYIDSQPDTKRNDLQALHKLMVDVLPKGKLWFLDGKDEKGKIVSNPNIGYGSYMHIAGGKAREFYQIGLSANTTGISVYIMGLEDKKYLANTYGKKLGKANVSGYCIKFKGLKDIDLDMLKTAIRYGLDATSKK